MYKKLTAIDKIILENSFESPLEEFPIYYISQNEI